MLIFLLIAGLSTPCVNDHMHGLQTGISQPISLGLHRMINNHFPQIPFFCFLFLVGFTFIDFLLFSFCFMNFFKSFFFIFIQDCMISDLVLIQDNQQQLHCSYHISYQPDVWSTLDPCRAFLSMSDLLCFFLIWPSRNELTGTS